MNDDLTYTAPPGVTTARSRALTVGVAGLVLSAVGAFLNPYQFFHSYLIGFVLVLGLALGSLALALVQYLTGGVWAVLTRRVFEAASRTLPFVLLLFLPLLLGLQHLYPWTRPEALHDEVLQRKAIYLNVPFFLARAAIYFAVWLALAYLVNRWSAAHERTGDPIYLRHLERLAGPGVVLYGLTITFAAVDWVMSLEPHWFSSIFGLLFVVGQGLLAIAFGIVTLVLLSGVHPYSELLRRKSLLDLGNLMLAFVMLWAYMSFAQFLIIWSANLPEEIPFYLRRMTGGWQWMALGLVVFHFALPFVVLLMRAIKVRPLALGAVAAWAIAMRWLDLAWIIAPTAHEEGHFAMHWLDIAAPLGLVGVWVAVFAWQYAARPLLPLRDPDLVAALEQH